MQNTERLDIKILIIGLYSRLAVANMWNVLFISRKMEISRKWLEL